MAGEEKWVEGMPIETKSLEGLRIDRTKAGPRAPSAGWVLLLLMLLAGGGAVAWFALQGARPVVRTVAVVLQGGGTGSATSLNASGYVTARRQATVSSKITGKVIEVLVEEGRKVSQGDVLARLDSTNADQSLRVSQARLEATRAMLGETQVALEQARREVRRTTELTRTAAATQRELERNQTDLDSLTARLARQQADIAVALREFELAQQEVSDHTIRAPFDGIVTSKNAQPGEMISPMSSGGFTRTGICTIVDMSSLEIEVDVGESFINRVTPGQQVQATLDSYPDWQIPCKVIAIIPAADRQKATVKVRVGFDKLDPRILPDMSVKVAFQSAADAKASASAGITIPKAAVSQQDGRDVVWVVREGKAERRAVTISPAAGDQVKVAAGLSGGERIVIEGAAQLTEGTLVTEAQP